ncbi:hypothetical protein [Halomarina rubra]|uniref:Lipoprotein n=1 Tax=Halomarina rubra TaxID=2071873 RepID=A0ABD6ASD2_9EURY|nr:hypothetical protein [Halomarina rubra]
MRRLLPLFLAALVVLAGCNGLGLPGGADDTTVAPNATATGTPAPPGENVTAQSVKNETLATLDEVTTYRLAVDQRTDYVARNESENTTATGRFNRTVRDAALVNNVSASGVSLTVETYVDGENQTLYQYSPAYAQDFDSNWLRSDVSGNFSATWEQYDTLARQRALLNASNVTLEGTERLNGTDVYVLNGTVEESEYERLGLRSAGVLNVSTVSATFYVSVANATLVRSQVDLAGTRQARGESFEFERSVDLRFSGYGDPVTVDIPDDADDAVRVDNGTAASR